MNVTERQKAVERNVKGSWLAVVIASNGDTVGHVTTRKVQTFYEAVQGVKLWTRCIHDLSLNYRKGSI